MKVVILRHATRSPSGMGDSPLNTFGLSQAQMLAHELLSPRGPLPHPTHLWASPKLRAQQTLAPLSQAVAIPLKTDARLDERHSGESSQDFVVRIRELIRDASNLPPTPETCLYFCTHLDWLEEVMPLLDSDMSELEISTPWSTAEYRVYQLDGAPGSQIWKLKTRGRAE